MNQSMKPFSVNLFPYQLEQLKLLGKKQDRTVAYLVRYSIDKFLAMHSGEKEILKMLMSDPIHTNKGD